MPEHAMPAGARSTFPVVVALEALAAWFRDPTPDRRAWLAEAISAIVRAAGAAGAWLAVDAPPLPAFTVGYGTLGEPPGDDARAGAVVPHELRADDGRVLLGTLWLDEAKTDGTLAARALELALDAAWARASVHATAERLEALDAATRGIAEVLDVERVLQLIVDRVRDLVRARYAALGIVDPLGGIERFVTSGITAEQRARIGALPRGHGLLGLIIREGRSFRIPDIAQHPASYGFPPHHPPMRSFLGVPVSVKRRSVGNLYLADKIDAEEFSESDERLVQMFALHAGIAIENARLHDQVQRLAIVEERERIGKDLHDGIIQSLYAISLSLEDVPDLMASDPAEATERVDRAIDGLNVSIREIRSFILGLRSELGHGGDLVAGLGAIAHEYRMNAMIDTALDIEDEALAARLPVEHRVQLLHMAREAMSNAARHSGAARVRIRLAADGDGVSLAIEDDGVGFDPDAARASGHLGLANLRARASAMGGSLTVESEPGSGARIIVRLPPADRPDAADRPSPDSADRATAARSMETRPQ